MEREPAAYCILAIDDEQSILDNYRDFLEDIGYTVFIAQDSQTALKIFKSELPDAVICDLRMPEIDGLQLLATFKKEIPNLPFIFVSGTRDFNHVIQALRRGAADYLMKPILEMESLDHRIRKAIERAELEAQNRAYSEYLEDMVIQRTSELQTKSEQLEKINRELRREMQERALAEEQVRQSQLLLREVIDNVPYYISALDENGILILVNKVFANWHNKDPKELIGIPDTGWGEDVGNKIRIIRELEYDHEGTLEIIRELEIESPDGRKVFIKESLVRVTEEIIRRPMTLRVATNISDMVEANRQRQEANEIVQKTARMATIGVIAGGITHEINQPLNAVLLNTDTMRFILNTMQNDNVEKLKTLTETVLKNTNRISEIIRHMRNLWVFPVDHELNVIDLNESVRKAIDLVQQQVQNHMIKLEIAISEESISVLADEIQTEQIVINLISNSIHSLDKTEKKNKWIKLSTRLNQSSVELVVEDNGIGLPDVAVEELFDPFYSTGKTSGGTGLGLAVVNNFTKRFNGDITVFNNDFGGATFIINLPLVND